MSWSTKGDLQFGIFSKKGQQLKYVGRGITHTPDNPHNIPSGVLNSLENITSRKPNFHSQRVDNVYPDRVNALREAGLAPPIFQAMGELW